MRGDTRHAGPSMLAVRMKSPIAPPRITRMRFMLYCSGALRAPKSTASSAVTDRRYKLIPRKREGQNYPTVNERDDMQEAPAENAPRTPADLIAKHIRNRHPK